MVAPFIRLNGRLFGMPICSCDRRSHRISGRAAAQSEALAEGRGTQGQALTRCERTFHTASLVAPRIRVFTAGGDHEGGVFS